MGASRTLLRKITKAPVRDEAGKITAWGDLPAKPKRLKPGTRNRRIVVVVNAGDYEHSFHATKGPRVVRVAVGG